MAGAVDWDDEEPVFGEEEGDEDEVHEAAVGEKFDGACDAESCASEETAFVSPAPAPAIVGAGIAGVNSVLSGGRNEEEGSEDELEPSPTYRERPWTDVEQSEFDDFASGQDDMEGSLVGPALRILFAAATVMFTVSVGKLLLERRRRLIREYSEHLVFAQSTAHVRDLVNEFRKKTTWLPSGCELFKCYVDLSLAEKSITMHTILDMREVKLLLNVNDKDVIRAFRNLYESDLENERMAQMRFVSERLVPAARYDCLEFLRSMPTSMYARIEKDIIDSCAALEEVGNLDSTQRDDILKSKIRRRVRSLKRYGSCGLEE
mmetsp:Transcript_1908/g.5748  ORF Transcript_1908/g.5748 Transcript_1908/m.5748 type:complete len:319 (+) Transcript_1908:159-1115(+)